MPRSIRISASSRGRGLKKSHSIRNNKGRLQSFGDHVPIRRWLRVKWIEFSEATGLRHARRQCLTQTPPSVSGNRNEVGASAFEPCAEAAEADPNGGAVRPDLRWRGHAIVIFSQKLDSPVAPDQCVTVRRQHS
jgi:hypothetical protein